MISTRNQERRSETAGSEGHRDRGKNEKKERGKDSSGLQKSARRTLGFRMFQPDPYVLIIILPESLDVNARMHALLLLAAHTDIHTPPYIYTCMSYVGTLT